MKNITIIIAFAFCALTSFTSFSQSSDIEGTLQFKLELLSENGTWGVFVMPNQTIAPSQRTMAGSGQVTIVTPDNFTYADLNNLGGTWIENARVDNPVEANGKSYVSFGFVNDNPQIKLFPNEETLLFTFVAPTQFNGTLNLIDNENDPFLPPNSRGTNPGNDLGMMDFGIEGGIQYYIYEKNYGADNNATAVFAKNSTTFKAGQAKDDKTISFDTP